MQLTIFNGSHRGHNSNTKILLERFLDGFMTTRGNTYELVYLIRAKERNELVKLFRDADQVLLAFPLYTDAMPAIVKDFIESLEPLCGRNNNPNIGFIVQSGFPEATHSCCLERYLEKLALRLGCRYLGTVVKGGVEASRIPSLLDMKRHKWFCRFSKVTDFAGVGHFLDTEKLYRSFYQLGKTFGATGEFDRKIVLMLAQPKKLTWFSFWAFKSVGHSLYWDLLLKKNKAFRKRYNKPYTP